MRFVKESTVLRKTKKILRQQGWTKKKFHVDEGGRELGTNQALEALANGDVVRSCLFGALILAGAEYYPYASDEWEGLNDRSSTWLSRAVEDGTRFMSVTEFNDAPTTDLDAVLRVIDDAIRLSTTVERRAAERAKVQA